MSRISTSPMTVSDFSSPPYLEITKSYFKLDSIRANLQPLLSIGENLHNDDTDLYSEKRLWSGETFRAFELFLLSTNAAEGNCSWYMPSVSNR